MVSELKMQLPVCDLDAEQSQMEETLIRNSSFYVDESEKNIKEIVLKLFAVSEAREFSLFLEHFDDMFLFLFLRMM